MKNRIIKHLELGKRVLNKREYTELLRERGLTSSEIKTAWFNVAKRRG
jgi:hypothetical protein